MLTGHSTYIFPCNVSIAQRLEDGRGASGTGHIVPESRSLVSVVNEATGRTRGCELTIWVCWAGVLSELLSFRRIRISSFFTPHIIVILTS